MELNIIGKKLITEPISHTLTQGETNVDTFEINLPKMYGDIDLSTFSFKMRGQSKKNTIAEQVLTSSILDDKIILKWTVTSDFTAVEGLLSLELVGVNSDGDEIIKITSSDIYIKGNLIGSYSPPDSAIEQALAQMQLLVTKASSEADRARTYVGKSAYDIWLSEGNTGTVSDFISSLKGEKGDDGLGLKILGSFESIAALQTAYPNGGALNGGFMIDENYYYWDTLSSSWTSAGSLRGAKGDKGDKGDSGKAVILSDPTASSVNLLVEDNYEYHYQILSSLTVTFPLDSYSAFICFSSGDTASVVTFPNGTKFLGTDIFDGVFSPAANKRYCLGMWYDGLNNTVVVGAY